MNTPELGPKFKNINPENTSDTAVYTGSLSLINKEKEGIRTRLESLRIQGVEDGNLEVTGLRFKLKELNDQEREIRESMGQ
jgi:hypothetical protein